MIETMITSDALAREIQNEVQAESTQIRALRLMCFTTSMLQEMLKHRNNYYTYAQIRKELAWRSACENKKRLEV